MTRIQKANYLLVAGNGRNVGKTHLSCKIIRHLAKNVDVIGVKISSHFHPVENNTVLVKNKKFVLVEETQVTQKDSSLMKQAGAQKVYFMMAAQENLKAAFSVLEKLLPEKAIVCESGGLHEIINPGLFLFVNRDGSELTKQHHLVYSPIQIQNNGKMFDFDITRIKFKNKRFLIQNRKED